MHVRPLFAVALAALLSTPTAASAAQAKKGSSTKAAPAASSAQPAATAPQAPAVSIGGWLGYEMGDLDGIQLRLEGELPFQKLSPQVGLSLVGALGYSHLSDSAFGVDVSADLLKIVPAARFTLPVNPQLTLFGDAGLGLYWASVSTDLTFPGIGTQSASDSSFGLMMRLGAGGLYTLNPRTKLGVQLVLDPMFNDYDDTTFTFLAGVTYRL